MASIIIADDNLLFIKDLHNNIIREIPEISNILLSASGDETIKYLKENKPDIILLDINMPKGNGLDVIDYMKKNNYDTKIIIISSYYDKIYREPKILNKVFNILPKPVNVKIVIQNIRSILLENNYYNIEKFVIKELEQFNFNFKSIGFRYLVTATAIVIQDQITKFNLEKDIYVRVSKYYNISNSNTIKWCIDKLIKKMCLCTDYQILINYFRVDYNEKITSKTVITNILYKYNNW